MERFTLEVYDRRQNRVCSLETENETPYDAHKELSDVMQGTLGSSYIFNSDRKRARDGRLPLFRHTNRLTLANCALAPAEQAKRYAAWAIKQGLKTIHLFPAGRTGHSAESHYELRNNQALGVRHGITFAEVDPADWARA